MSQYKVKVNREGCISCGACVAACPENFELDDEGKSVPKKKVIEESELECNTEAKEVCPVEVISIDKVE